ncbi:unnamed protein product [Nippostrongylus brasiliensis]|uniref:Ricin B-type lectin domain-containing protein n=1 Tax=Nippostrongylus brasiliensis TaxID=27835 RepID=A0A0N4Y1L3_NIPBR|nr:unnamed protein product [Nippostrongylus brasiliensis]
MSRLTVILLASLCCAHASFNDEALFKSETITQRAAFENRAKRHVPWMVDRDFNEHHDEWYKYDCKRVKLRPECKGINGGSFNGLDCFQPKEKNVKDLHSDDGWHKELTCTATSPDDYVVLATSSGGRPTIVGRASVSKIIRCNNKGKWVTVVDGDLEVEVKEAFCYIVPRVQE